MAAFNFPASPVAGDKVTNSDSGITYVWQSTGYWKSSEHDIPKLEPSMFCLRVDGPPASDAVKLMSLYIPTGYEVDLSSYEFSLSANPASTQTYDILVNSDRDSDTIEIATDGSVTVNDVRGPYIGPVELDIYYTLGGTPDVGFGTFTLVTPIEVV